MGSAVIGSNLFSKVAVQDGRQYGGHIWAVPMGRLGWGRGLVECSAL